MRITATTDLTILTEHQTATSSGHTGVFETIQHDPDGTGATGLFRCWDDCCQGQQVSTQRLPYGNVEVH